MSTPPVIWWIRRDLRLGDNPAVPASSSSDGAPVVPVFVVDPALWEPAGEHRRAFLVDGLHALDDDLDGALVLRHGRPEEEIPRLAREVEAEEVRITADFGPYGRDRDERVGKALQKADVILSATGTPYAVEPGEVRKEDGDPFKVFTPFSRAWTAHGWDRPFPGHRKLPTLDGVTGRRFPARPKVDAELPEAGEAAARQRWHRFRDGPLADYHRKRDVPAGDLTSRLSVYLKWGCIHPRTLLADLDGSRRGHEVYRRELCWREFYADVLFHTPDSARQSLQRRLSGMKVDTGRSSEESLAAWAAGRTGYPIVDAGMRQLRSEGWMHNRVRMLTASFLVKDLHIDWRRGARHFMELLVDGDIASNQHGWQWVAGTGTDAAPFFRIFNPVLQGKKFDPNGDYIRRWVPELAELSAKDIHEPWKAANLPLSAADYPGPIVDHHAERDEALARYQACG